MNDHEAQAMKRHEFVGLVASKLRGHDIADHVALQNADIAMTDFENSEKCTVDDPDYVWGDEGAQIMADEHVQNYFKE